MKKYIFIFLFFISTILYTILYPTNKIDIIIFSYHRPLQLYALLESIKEYMRGYNNIYVIYRADNQEFKNGYDIVQKDFTSCIFLKQSHNPYQDFKPLTLQAFEAESSHVLFAVDDIIVKDYVDLQQCIKMLKNVKYYGFFLRLGTHLNYCYTMARNQAIPPLKTVDKNIYSWYFNKGEHDWCYPFSVDMTIYTKENIVDILKKCNYTSPNSLEAKGSFMTLNKIIPEKKGVCFGESKIINIPLNIVQKDYPNNLNLNKYTVDYLLQLLNDGYKIDIKPLKGIQNCSAHADCNLTFIKR